MVYHQLDRTVGAHSQVTKANNLQNSVDRINQNKFVTADSGNGVKPDISKQSIVKVVDTPEGNKR